MILGLIGKVLGMVMLIPLAIGGFLSLFFGALAIVIVGGFIIFGIMLIIALIAGIIDAITGG